MGAGQKTANRPTASPHLVFLGWVFCAMVALFAVRSVRPDRKSLRFRAVGLGGGGRESTVVALAATTLAPSGSTHPRVDDSEWCSRLFAATAAPTAIKLPKELEKMCKELKEICEYILAPYHLIVLKSINIQLYRGLLELALSESPTWYRI